ncbi:MAG: gliding motility-associated ABC transporter permease subunit GldF [Bacteroidetes bacterium]|nr:gliding motility-associated ABC transporter permease subunit GldF [Bacteroidota bacterium]
MTIIFWKEINAFFNSLAGYVVIIFFLTSIGGLLWINPDTSILYGGFSNLQAMFDFAPYLLIVLSSAITMGAWTIEKQTGMMELLITTPLKITQIIIGKYLASIFIIFFALALTLIYYFSIYYLANPIGNVDSSSIVGSYFGLILLSASFVAISIFGASLVESQLISFLINIILCFSFYSLFEMISKIQILSKFSLFISNIGGFSHYYSLGRGLIDSRDIVYFLVNIILMIYLTKIVLKHRR